MRLTKDLLAGLLFCAFGIGAAAIAHGYSLGTLNRMGSGFFPTAIGVGLTVLGAIVAIRAVLKPETSEPVAALDFRPIFFIGAAIVLYGLLVEDFGLVAALAALIVVARLAGREGSLAELVLMVAILIAVAVGIFVYALGIRLPLWPR
jgi:hypothetical protein